MNQLKVTGMLSSPCAPLGQPTALLVPHDALKILASGRATDVAPVAVAGKAQTRRSAPSAAKALAGRRRVEDLSGAGIGMGLFVRRRRPSAFSSRRWGTESRRS
jgi:hypothetical protein